VSGVGTCWTKKKSCLKQKIAFYEGVRAGLDVENSHILIMSWRSLRVQIGSLLNYISNKNTRV
jgi:hypothetical protein